MESLREKVRCYGIKSCLCWDPSPRPPENRSQQPPTSSTPQAATSSQAAKVPIKVHSIFELKLVLGYLDQAFDENGQLRRGQVAVPEVVKNNLTDAIIILERVREHCTKQSDEQGPVTDIAGESQKVLREVFEGAGNLHWIMAGLVLVASIMDKQYKKSSIAVKCFKILVDLRKLGHHLVSLLDLQGLPEGDTIPQATSLIVEGIILCLDYYESRGKLGSPKRFGFVDVHKNNYSTLRKQIKALYPSLLLITSDRKNQLLAFPRNFPENIVGLDEKVKKVLKLLRVEDGKVMPGIQAVLLVGMGGIGKTTLGKAVCSELPIDIDNFAMVELGESFNEEFICKSQAMILRRLSGKKQKIKDIKEGQQKLKDYLGSRTTPVFLFLDNVFCRDNLEALISTTKVALPDQSRIVVTSRDESLSRVFQKVAVSFRIYRVPNLDKTQAREVLKQYLKKFPSEREAQVNLILQSCGGLPLTIHLLGGFLKGKENDESAWENAIKAFQESFIATTPVKEGFHFGLSVNDGDPNLCSTFSANDSGLPSSLSMNDSTPSLRSSLDVNNGDPNLYSSLKVNDSDPNLHSSLSVDISDPSLHSILSVNDSDPNLHSTLSVSYGDLTEHARSVFLDVSFLLKNVEWDWVKALDSSSVELLKDRSLIEKDDSSNAGLSPYCESILSMESELLYTFAGDFSITARRWLCGPALRVRVHDVVANFSQNLSQSTRVARLRAGKGDSLPKLLQADYQGKCKGVEGIVIKGCTEPLLAKKLEDTCKSLRIVLFEGVRLEGRCLKDPIHLQISSTPNGFPFKDPSRLDELRVLEIGTHVYFDFEHVQFPRALEILKLSHLAKLREFREDAFKRCLSLHTFEVLYCQAFQKLPPSFCDLEKLRVLILLGNKALRSIPEELHRLVSLQSIMIWSLQRESKCEFWGSISNSLSRLTCLENIALDCAQTQKLPGGLGNLRSLKRLKVLGCKSIEMLPDGFCNLSSLNEMRLAGCQGLRKVPNNFGNLTELCRLELQGCECLARLPDSISQLVSLKELTLQECKVLDELPRGFGELKALSGLWLSKCEQLRRLPDNFGELQQLRTLELTGCKVLIELPAGFGKLLALSELWLSGCESLRQLPGNFGELKSLRTLTLSGCKSLTQLSKGFGKLAALSWLLLYGCDNLEQLPDDFCDLTTLRKLNLSGCRSLKNLPGGLGKLHALSDLLLDGCENLCKLPNDFGELKVLKSLGLPGCKVLTELPGGFRKLAKLSRLTLTGCESLKRLPSGMGILNLSHLVLEGCEALRQLPYDLVRLKFLKVLKLTTCKSLEELPEGFGRLDALFFLRLEDCASLEKLPSDFRNLSSLKFLSLRGCQKLDVSLEDVGPLKSLDIFDIRGCKLQDSHNLEAMKFRLTAFIAYEDRDYTNVLEIGDPRCQFLLGRDMFV